MNSIKRFKRHLRDFFLFFFIQVASYSLLTYNFKAIADHHLPKALVSDGINAAFSFFVIRKIAKSDDSIVACAGYVCGSLVGTTIGMLL